MYRYKSKFFSSEWQFFRGKEKRKFTIEHIFKEQPFLDIHIKNPNGQIITDIYHKPQTPNKTSISKAITPKTTSNPFLTL